MSSSLAVAVSAVAIKAVLSCPLGLLCDAFAIGFSLGRGPGIELGLASGRRSIEGGLFLGREPANVFVLIFCHNAYFTTGNASLR